MNTAVFIGHSQCYGLDKNKLKESIIDCINDGVTRFLSGGQGDFDHICANEVFKLKKNYPNIENILVIPYLSFNVVNKKIFDTIIFPDGFEKYHFKSAIPQRNKYMVNCSDVAICYIRHGLGNAVNTYKFAQKKNLVILNLSTFND